MNAGGHGRETAEVLRRRPRSSTSPAGGAARWPARSRRSARLPPLGARRRPRSSTGADFRGRRATPAAVRGRASPRSCAGGASTSPAARTRARCSANPPGDSAGPAHRRRRASRACGSAARWCRRSTPTSSRPSRAPPPTTCARWCARCAAGSLEATGVALEPELRMVGFEDDAVSTTTVQPRPAPPRAPRPVRRVDPRLRRALRSRRRRRRGRRRLRLVAIGGRGRGRCWSWRVRARRSSPFLDVDHVVGAGARRARPPRRSSRPRRGSTRGDAMVWLDTGAAVAGIEALPVGPRRATSSASGPTPCASPSPSARPRRGSTARPGTALVDGTGRVLERVEAARRRCPSCSAPKLVPPVGRHDRRRSARARVAGALAGLAAAGTRLGRRSPTAASCSRLVSGPEIRLGRADRRWRRRSAPRWRCSTRSTATPVALRRRERARPTRSPADESSVECAECGA